MDRSDSPSASRAAGLRLPDEALAAMRDRLHAVAGATVAAVTDEVPGYRGTLDGPQQANLERAVETALRGFLVLASGARGNDPRTLMTAAVEGAYALGRGEARGGRSMDALLAAYRVGARVAWRELASSAVGAGVAAPTLVGFAELVFAYIDELSAASVAGHADELATSGRVRERYLERLGHALVTGADPTELAAATQRADYEPPDALLAVVLPESHVRPAQGRLDPRTLHPTDDVPGLAEEDAILLAPVTGPTGRPRVLRALAGVPCVVGPARPFPAAADSFRRALRARRLLSADSGPVDTEEHLPELVVGADPDALADLRARALAPLSRARPATVARLEETLRAWLLHHGRRDDIAAELFVHAQTVRYRMGQLRELYGEALDDPRTVLELTVALGTRGAAEAAMPQPASPADR